MFIVLIIIGQLICLFVAFGGGHAPPRYPRMKFFVLAAMAWAALPAQSLNLAAAVQDESDPGVPEVTHWHVLANAAAAAAALLPAAARCDRENAAENSVNDDETIDDIEDFSGVPDIGGWAQLAANAAGTSDGCPHDMSSDAVPSPTENGSMVDDDEQPSVQQLDDDQG